MTAQRAGRRRRLYLECSETYKADHHTGIQRVARNVIRESLAQAARRDVDVIPVFRVDRIFHRARVLPDGVLASVPPVGAPPMRQAYRKTLGAVARVIPHSGAREWLLASGDVRGFTRSLRAFLRGSTSFGNDAVDRIAEENETVTFEPGDVLCCIDLNFSTGLVSEIRALRERSITVAALIYESIPIHRQMWNPELAASFEKWLDMMIEHADVLVSISKTVQNALAAYASQSHGMWPRPGQRAEFFHLGCGLEERSLQPTIRPELVSLLAGSAGPVFLNVGWLDWRKNQLFLIDALSSLWRRGIESRLLLVGKKGNSTKAVRSQLRREPHAAARVTHFHDLSDDELEYCYAHADAMVYPSLEEGFGLPLIEALSRQLPVFASDIAVFRELADGYAVFFAIDSPTQLVGQLERFCLTREFPATRSAAEFRWPSWAESVSSLLDIVLMPAPYTVSK